MDITLVYFIYGLAFFSMGLAMLLESNRSPLLAEARILWPLAVFGLVHGSHEWLEMFLDKSGWLVFQDLWLVSWTRIGLLAISFASLAVFALQALKPQRRLRPRERWLFVAGLGLYVIFVILVSEAAWIRHVDRLSHVDAMLRYFVAVPAALLAGVALFHQAAQASAQGRTQIGNMLRWSAWGFTLYSLTQLIAPPGDVFPGTLINTESFTGFFGFPIQLVRAVLAIVITFSLVRATQIVDRERRLQLLEAQRERLEALEKVQQDLLEREALREELLRRTVIAQEDERARIARELHDEMAQILTGFTLHLATLCDVACDQPQVKSQVDILKALSQQMSRSLYHLVHDLRPAQLDDLGLVAALRYLLDDTRDRVGLETTMTVEGKRARLDPLVETVLYRGAQEALTNVVRHAGVSEATLLLNFEADKVSLCVQDNGKGFVTQADQLPEHSWGLVGMRERVESVGGKLKLTSAPGRGTLVEVVIPNGKEFNNATHSSHVGG